eukprot:GHVR01156435.1.p1 GENE.GHVR01156435.1~~GHVR01156435.1.p1  ORF type:complete len:173 (+),score=64.46 GHVR01156435.1:407-925(+)
MDPVAADLSDLSRCTSNMIIFVFIHGLWFTSPGVLPSLQPSSRMRAEKAKTITTSQICNLGSKLCAFSNTLKNKKEEVEELKRKIDALVLSQQSILFRQDSPRAHTHTNTLPLTHTHTDTQLSRLSLGMSSHTHTHTTHNTKYSYITDKDQYPHTHTHTHIHTFYSTCYCCY